MWAIMVHIREINPEITYETRTNTQGELIPHRVLPRGIHSRAYFEIVNRCRHTIFTHEDLHTVEREVHKYKRSHLFQGRLSIHRICD